MAPTSDTLAGPRPSDTGSLKPGDTLSGKYTVEKLLGEGGMGEVFVAQDGDLGRKVALKVLRGLGASGQAAAAERLQREARILAQIGHPNIVQIFDIGRTSTGAPFLVMELLEGETLFARATREGPMPVSRAVEIVADVLSALRVVHAKGMVHRDMKPENVFLANDGTGREITKLLDLGIAKARQPDANTPALTETGAIVGTPYFMAPEQAMGVADIDGRADLYAVGGILYTLLAGRTPFQASNVIALLRMIVDTDPEPIEKLRPDVPPDLAAVIRRAMERDREKRFPDAYAFHEAIRPFSTLIMSRPSVEPRAGGPPRKLLVGGAVALVVGLVAAYALSRDVDERPRPPIPARSVPARTVDHPPAKAGADPIGEPPPARTVTFIVDAVPDDAVATLEGRPCVNCVCVIEPSPEPRTLVVSAEGHRTEQQQVVVQQDGQRIQVRLEPERRHGGTKGGQPANGTYRGNLGLSKNPYGGH